MSLDPVKVCEECGQNINGAGHRPWCQEGTPMTTFSEEAQRAATNRAVALELVQNQERTEYLKDYAGPFEAAVMAIVGPEFLENDARLLTDEEQQATWPRFAGDPIVGMELDGLLFTGDPGDPDGEASGVYVFAKCPAGHYRSRWVRSGSDEGMENVGDLLLASCKTCERKGAPEPAGAKAVMQEQLRYPVPSLPGGPDSDNLAAIAHNLGVIAHQLYDFFDCGASMAGRGT